IPSTPRATASSTRFTASATRASSSFMSSTIRAVDSELRSFVRVFSCSVTGSESRFSVAIFTEESDCESNVVNMFASHSSGSYGWGEMRRLKIRTWRPPLHLDPDCFENQIAAGYENASDMRNLKLFALHRQITDRRDGHQRQLCCRFLDNLLRYLIVTLRSIDYVFSKAGQPFICNRRSVYSRTEIVHGTDAEIRTGEFGGRCFWTTTI